MSLWSRPDRVIKMSTRWAISKERKVARNAPKFALIRATPTDTRRAHQNATQGVLGGTHASLPTFCRLDTLEKVCQENIPSTNRTKKRQISSLDLNFFNLLTYMKKRGLVHPLTKKDRRFFIFGLFVSCYTASVSRRYIPWKIGKIETLQECGSLSKKWILHFSKLYGFLIGGFALLSILLLSFIFPIHPFVFSHPPGACYCAYSLRLINS